jgi:hypothetical protein
MYRMCSTITEFGTTVISCLAGEFPELAARAMGQYMRCWYAQKTLGEEWGTAKGEEAVFVDGPTNATVGGVDFIRDGFEWGRMDRGRGKG